MAHLCRTLKEFDDHLMSMKLRGQIVDTPLCNCFLSAVGLIPEIREPLPSRDYLSYSFAEAAQPYLHSWMISTLVNTTIPVISFPSKVCESNCLSQSLIDCRSLS